MPSGEPDGLWFLHIHHLGELEKGSKRLAPLALAFCSMARWLASRDQSQLVDDGSLLAQFNQ